MRWQARSRQLLGAGALLTMAGTAALLRAQGPPVQNSRPPERGVARISVMNGQVSVRRGDSGEWVAGILNAPLMVEDRVAAGQGSRAEVQFDGANLIRIGANAEIRLGALDYSRINIQIAHGTVSFRVLRESHVQVELDTPTVSVRPAHIGLYRIYVKEDGQTEITVRLGDAEIYTPRGVEQMQAGQTMLARGTSADPEFRIVPAIAIDEWDRWNEQRDHELLSSRSSLNVPQDIYGTEGMDSSGRWVNDPTYGSVWSPTVGPDWAPYQDGRWVWEDWYGWTWVSNEPWGWAPYHYGRWFYGAPYGWCWYPGGFGPHYWSPALVAFFGFGGGGVGFGFGFGNIGWVALAPFEVMHPWWGAGFYGGFRGGIGVGVTNANILASYRNARVANGVRGVSAADFAAGRFHNISRVGGEQMRSAGLVRGPLPVAPTAANLRYSNRAVANVPHSSENVRFFSHNQAAPVQRVPFAEQQRAVQQLSRQPVSAGAASAGSWRHVEGPSSSSAGAARAGVAGNGAGAMNRDSGWQRFGEPRAATTGGSGYGTARTNTGQSGGSSYRSYSAPASNYGGRSPQAIRIAPSVVHERSASQTEKAPRTSSAGGSGDSHVSHSSGGGGGGGGSHSGGGGHR